METVLITGISRGIGFATAKKFLDEGYRVIGTSTSGEASQLPQERAVSEPEYDNNVTYAGFWRRVAAEGSATTDATLEEMSGWLCGAIESKLSTIQPSERANTIIALDAHGWADRIVHPTVVSSLSSSGLDPAQGLGLGGIAITGAATSNSTWFPGTLR